MVEADATLMQQAAAASLKADHVYIQATRIDAPQAAKDLAAENALQAGQILNIVIQRWLKTL